MKWQFKRPENGLIDGKTPEEWERAGVSRWLVSYGGLTYAVGNPRILDCFHTDREYAPATVEMLPAPWPKLWQWRKMERDMDERTWHAVARWLYGRRGEEAKLVGGADSYSSRPAAEAGEWWAPADQDGNPCDWPDVAPQPVVVIPAAEMTALVLHGHLAMGGTWKWRDSVHGWTAQDGGEGGAWWDPSVEDDGEQWAPCDEHGNFCELRRVVSDTSAEVERRRVDELDRELAEARQELSRYRGGVARLAAEMEDLLSAGPEVDGDKADELADY